MPPSVAEHGHRLLPLPFGLFRPQLPGNIFDLANGGRHLPSGKEMAGDPSVDVLTHVRSTAALEECKNERHVSRSETNDALEKNARRLHAAQIKSIGLAPKLVEKRDRDFDMRSKIGVPCPDEIRDCPKVLQPILGVSAENREHRGYVQRKVSVTTPGEFDNQIDIAASIDRAGLVSEREDRLQPKTFRGTGGFGELSVVHVLGYEDVIRSCEVGGIKNIAAEGLSDQGCDLPGMVGSHDGANLAGGLDPLELLDDVAAPRGNIFSSVVLTDVLAIVPGHCHRPSGGCLLLVAQVLDFVDDGLWDDQRPEDRLEHIEGIHRRHSPGSVGVEHYP